MARVVSMKIHGARIAGAGRRSLRRGRRGWERPLQAATRVAMPSDADNKFRSRLFGFVCLLQITANLDAGVLPAVLVQVKSVFGVGYEALGLLGALVYIGLTVACPVSGNLVMYFQPKYVVASSVLLNATAVTLFGASQNVSMLMIARFLIGLSQGPIFIYAPVWVDEFSPEGSQTKWMSLLQANVALGIMFGYVSGGMLTNANPDLWRVAFFVQGAILAPLGLGLLFVDGRHVNAAGLAGYVKPPEDDDSEGAAALERGAAAGAPGSPTVARRKTSAKRARRGTVIALEEIPEPEAKPVGAVRRGSILMTKLVLPESHESGVSVRKVRRARVDSIFVAPFNGGGTVGDLGKADGRARGSTEPSPSLTHISEEGDGDSRVVSQSASGAEVGAEDVEVLGLGMDGRRASPSPTPSEGSRRSRDGSITMANPLASQESKEFVPPTSLCGQLSFLLHCRVFVYVTLALAALYFVVTGIQFWITDYMVTELGADPAGVVVAFALTSLTAPTAGVFVGGYVVDYFGGYSDSSGRSMCVALRCCVGFGTFALGFSVLTCFMGTLASVIFALWFVLFFGGCLVPPATGICISSVDPSMRSFASAWSMTLYNLFGYALAPLLCGLVAQWTNLTWGFRLVMLMSGGAMIAMVAAWRNAETAWAIALKNGASDTTDVAELRDETLHVAPTRRRRSTVFGNAHASDDIAYEMARQRAPTFTVWDGFLRGDEDEADSEGETSPLT